MSAFVLSCALLFTLTHAKSIRGPQCWTETKKCRYAAFAAGYECKDYYVDKQTLCHPKMKYKKKCNKVFYSPRTRPAKPSDYVDWEQTKSTRVSYDKNYGPHMQGYPQTGTSDYYYTKKLPSKPYGVTQDPFPPPTGSNAPGELGYVVPPKTVTQKSAYTSPPAYTASPRSAKSSKYTVAPKATQTPVYAAPSYGPASSPPSKTSGAQHPQYSY